MLRIHSASAVANSDISNVSQPKKELTMTAIDTTNTDLHSMLLKGKTALITGGNSGIGLATARRFVAEGARVAITGRDAATLAAAANELGVTAIKSDVLDRQARSSLFDRIKNEFGHLDILFANAGIAKFSPIEETLERISMTSCDQRHCGFPDRPSCFGADGAGASIILNGSMAATIGSGESSAYAASKASVRAMTASLPRRGNTLAISTA
jgi:NAD(P)-dependent dehydrogenase (short-subunit alcohol dehydrogenase family)